MAKKIAVLVGSLRKGSFSRQVAKILIDRAPKSLSLEIVEIAALQLYNQDLDENPPKEWIEFRRSIKEFDGILFVTPEYNRSVPAVLKNAIDVGSRPYGKSVWQGKAGGIMSVSPGAIGGFGANHHLRQSLVFLDVPVMQQPEAYFGAITKVLDKEGKISDEAALKFLGSFMTAFAAWVETLSPKFLS